MSRRTLLATGAGFVVAAGAIALLVLPADAAERSAAGTTIGGVPAGELDRAQLVALVDQQTKAPPARLTARFGEEELQLPWKDLGLSVDAEATADKVLKTSGAGKRWLVFGSVKGSHVVPVVRRDDEALEEAVDRVELAAARKEAHGDLAYRDGQVVTVPPSDGRLADEDEVATALEGVVERLPFASSVTIPTQVVPAHVTAADLVPLAETAKQLVAAPLVLEAADLSATITQAQLGRQLTVLPVGDGEDHGVRLGLRANTAEVLAKPVAAQLSREPVEPVLSAPVPTTMLEEKGDATWRPVKAAVQLTAPGRLGRTVAASLVLEQLATFVQDGVAATGPLVLTSTPTPPKSSDAQARAVDSALGSFTTNFACCQGRVTNIRLIARTIDGTLIGPGQQFSLNGIVGPRTREKGYVEAPFILEGELSKDIGGGVSQFATTTMNAAFFAGLRLDRFTPHSFYISRYPAGREATVNYPGLDLKWTNDTGAAVLVRTSSTATSVTVTLYGKDDGRTVRAITGPRTPVKGRDFRIAIVREVSTPGQPVRRNTYRTTYNKPPEDH